MGSWNGITDLPAGHVVLGSDLLPWSTVLKVVSESYFVSKPGDQTLTTNVTLTNDTDLVLAVVAGATYRVFTHLIYNTSTTAKMKLQWTAPAGSAMTWQQGGLDPASTGASGAQVLTPLTLASVATLGGTGADVVAIPTGKLVVGASGGNLQLQWAQSVSSGSTIMRADSHLHLTRVA